MSHMTKEELRRRAEKLLALHHGPKALVLPNAWDCPSAALFEKAGFPAIATTSGGVAAVLGYSDHQYIPPDEMLLMVGRIAASVNVPVTADLEAGYGNTPEEVAETIRKAIRLGVAGGNIEDTTDSKGGLVDIAYQVEVIKAVRAVALEEGIPFVLNARVDAFIHDLGGAEQQFREGVKRALAYRDAGADCVFPIGLKERDQVAAFVREVDCPVNVIKGATTLDVAELEELGIQRITYGTTMMRAALPFVRHMAQEVQQAGWSKMMAQAEFSHDVVNGFFGDPADR